MSHDAYFYSSFSSLKKKDYFEHHAKIYIKHKNYQIQLNRARWNRLKYRESEHKSAINRLNKLKTRDKLRKMKF